LLEGVGRERRRKASWLRRARERSGRSEHVLAEPGEEGLGGLRGVAAMGEGLANHFDCAFEFGLNGDVDAMCEQGRNVGLMGGAGDDFERFVEAASVLDGEVDGVLFGEGEEQYFGVIDTGGMEDFGACGISPDAVEAGGAEVLEERVIEFND
jgi:hypothetical protein